jgi:hypothetical protein
MPILRLYADNGLNIDCGAVGEWPGYVQSLLTVQDIDIKGSINYLYCNMTLENCQ